MKNNLVGSSLSLAAKKNAGLFCALAAVVAGLVAASLLPPWILKWIIDANLVPRVPDGLGSLAAIYLSAIVLIGVFDFLKEAILATLGQKITREIRKGMMEKMIRLPAIYFSRNDSGAVMSRFTNDVDTVNAMFSGGIVGMAVDSFKIIGIYVSIFLFSGRLGLMSLFLLPVIALITRFFQRRMLAAQTENRVQTGRLNTHLSESIRNVRMIKVFGKEAFMEKRYEGILDDNYATISRINFFDAIFPPVIQILRALVIVLVVVFASARLHFLGITAGMIAATIELISGLFVPVENIGMEFQNIQGAVSGIARVNEFAREGEDSKKDPSIRAIDIVPDRAKASISFQGLCFGYDGSGEVLSDVSLDIKPLDKVTFTGRTGVGKTTLFRLVMGLLEPTSGKITINGIDVCRIPNSEKKHLFGYVDQNFFLIRGTVADQITLRDPSIHRDAVERAIAFVGMDDYVRKLPEGFDTPVNGDNLFSQGQKQLLSIARALVTDPPILLLDEMTANLDSITEERIVRILRKAGEKRTILSISHRPSSMIASDLVVILENGRVRNAGSPEEMIERDEWFRSHIELEHRTWDCEGADCELKR